ncbi:MAG: hypothetical protein ACI36Z_07465, partial [Alloprevotella sp.]
CFSGTWISYKFLCCGIKETAKKSVTLRLEQRNRTQNAYRHNNPWQHCPTPGFTPRPCGTATDSFADHDSKTF